MGLKCGLLCVAVLFLFIQYILENQSRTKEASISFIEIVLRANAIKYYSTATTIKGLSSDCPIVVELACCVHALSTWKLNQTMLIIDDRVE